MFAPPHVAALRLHRAARDDFIGVFEFRIELDRGDTNGVAVKFVTSQRS